MLNVEMAQLVLTKKKATVVHVDQVSMEPPANFVINTLIYILKFNMT